jgi:hypothetical protein
MAAEIVQIMLRGRAIEVFGTDAAISPVLQESCTP